ncbi:MULTISPECIES: OmpA family protein [unclassified Mesorhizobium]|uniref:OmpA family protein n=1 Tax=unclassified Mesorhizobium TaxID=325217 RepID=UPI001CCA9BE6|nr:MULTISPECIES: OmpA family protein [unclassified Mesorhizobium]MBZ9742257.1 OmpA family protein [Mesorhizobium sp. CO1-1-4]MBZ9805840.1 OmpA family protein [Mesorhizobium sp. ES1-6]
MKRQSRILAGTALGLLMASAPLGATPLQGTAAFGPMQRGATPLIILAQDTPTDQGQGDQEQPRKKKREQQQQTEQAPAAEQPAPAAEEQQPRRKKRDQQQQAEQAPAGEAAPATDEQQPRRKKRDQQQQAEQAPAGEAAPATDEQQPRRKKRDQQQQTEQAPAAEQPAPATEEQQPRKKKRDQQQQTEQAPAGEAAPATDEQQPRKKKRDQQQQTEQAPAGEAAPANDNQPTKPGRKHKQDQQNEAPAAVPETAPTPKEAPAGEATPKVEPAPAGEQPVQGEQPQDKTKKHGRKPAGEQPANGEQPATGEQSATGRQPTTGEQPTGEQPATGGSATDGKAAPVQGENPVQGEAPADKNAAPILDSQKDARRKGRGENGRNPANQPANQNGEEQNGGQQNGAQNAQQGGDEGRKPVVAPVDQGPPPTDDRAAQEAIKTEKIVPATQEKGKRLERAPDEDIRDRRRPKGVDVLKEIGDRVIVQFNDQTFVQSNDRPRLTRGAKDVYYEDLPQGRTRETVERDNGFRIVTIRNRYGDILQRSRIAPDGREYVLSYVDERSYQDEEDWRDPGDDLPPMRLTIPRRDYILDSEDVESPDDYYTFLEQPPVEKVQRLYSINEVKRSARVRDIARRIDLDTLNFEFGSSSISDTEVQKLQGVADAMEKLLKKNPAETFLIEGHTDAVGTPEANLALSDRRAEAVAEALTNAFGIPPENLTTQGYGEEYLKVDTSAPNRENRRVAIRRITSLVAPVASNN